MTSAELRNSFLEYFRNLEHHIVPSAPVFPKDDPTLLFTNAGMNPFKEIFLGLGTADHKRVADSQKCIRVSGKHNDLEEVGRDTYHHTFFEMLGNWSFGDYFKAEAIAWAWELLTGVWKLPKSKLYATVFAGDSDDGVDPDEESAVKWREMTDIDPGHILRFGVKDNFWEMGDSGPCGPCSEIHIDRGPDFCGSEDPDHTCRVNGDCGRYIELWNLVFIQYNRDPEGALHLLPQKHVDTGAGFERLVAVLQNKTSNYDTDLFTPIINRIADLSGIEPGGQGEEAVAFNVIADHIRALSFAIADGAIPGNEGRGYVLRRLLRRAARFGRVLKLNTPFIHKLVEPLSQVMGEAYPELVSRKEVIIRIVRAEEESFGRTLDRGLEIFEELAGVALKRGRVLGGEDAFLLHDTFGFPLDLTELLAREKNLEVDRAGFERAMGIQRKRSRVERGQSHPAVHIKADISGSEFIGYSHDEAEAEVVHCDEKSLILNRTPFYAESGGQVGDWGEIIAKEYTFSVFDTRFAGQHIVHFGEITSGRSPRVGDQVLARIDVPRRRATERNHTVTHLLHFALRRVIGDHVQQSGSLVHPDYMRFDFSHFEKLEPAQLHRLEDVVNEVVLSNRKVRWQILPFDRARELGAIALFGEKYGNEVRMVEVSDTSRELCGGTHVRATGEIGDFIITAEMSVAAGVRRIESKTGFEALAHMRERENGLLKAARLLGCNPEEVPDRTAAVLEERRELENELRRLGGEQSRSQISRLLTEAVQIDGTTLVAAEIIARDVEDLKKSGDLLRDGMGSGVGLLAAVIKDKLNFICVVTRDLIDGRGITAGEMVKKVAALAGGGGGGAPHMAMAGAREPEKLALALSKAPEILRQMLEQQRR